MIDTLNDHIKYFNAGREENNIFWSCLRVQPVFENMTIVDLGCGHGRMCIDLAQINPSSRVIGIDLNEELIEFAKWNLKNNYLNLESQIDFICADLASLPSIGADVFVSKDTFEHVQKLDEVLEIISSHMNLGGRLYTGFRPLYYSPFGGHPRIHNFLPVQQLPWLHCLLPENIILELVNRSRVQPASSIYDLGLNKLTCLQFKSIFHNSSLHCISFETNLPGKSMKATAMNLLSKIKFLNKYMIYSIDSILEKRC